MRRQASSRAYIGSKQERMIDRRNCEDRELFAEATVVCSENGYRRLILVKCTKLKLSVMKQSHGVTAAYPIWIRGGVGSNPSGNKTV